MSFWPPYAVDVKDGQTDYQRPRLKDVAISKYLATFFAETSLQGIPKLVQQAGFLKKIFWLMALLVCILGLYWQMSGFVDRLVQWEANTAVSVKTARELYFPAITLCNNNPTWIGSESEIPTSRKLSRKKRWDFPTLPTLTTDSNLIGSLLSSLADSLDMTTPSTETIVDNIIESIVNQTLTEISNVVENVTGEIISQLNETLTNLTSQLNETLSGDGVNNATLLSDVLSQLAVINKSLSDAEFANMSLSEILEQITQTINATFENVTLNSIEEISGLVNQTLNNIQEGLENATGLLNETLANVLTVVISDINSTLLELQETMLGDILNETLNSLIDGLENTTNVLNGTISKILDDATGQIFSVNKNETANGPVSTLLHPVKLLSTLAGSVSVSSSIVEQSMTQQYETQSIIDQCLYEDRRQLGHQLCDMIIGCRYNGKACDITKDFATWHWNPVYGNCYTFNAGYKVADKKSNSEHLWNMKLGDDGLGVRKSYKQGDIYGLYLLLNVDLERYSDMTQGVGWRIVVHNQTQMPFPEDGGIFVAPGTSTRIALTLTSTQKLGTVDNVVYTAKYSDCVTATNYDKSDPRNAYTTMMEVSYSTQSCFKTCYQKAVMTNCSCYDMGYPNTGSAFADINGATTMTGCSYNNSVQWECKERVFLAYSEQKIDCDCPDSCSEISSNYAMSFLRWPNSKVGATVCSNVYNVLFSRINGTDPMCTSTSYIASDVANPASSHGDSSVQMMYTLHQCAESSSQDAQTAEQTSQYSLGSRFGEVYIYFRDFNYETIEESENISFADLLGWIGGILGLFLGFSMMTLFEYIQLLVDMSCILTAKLIHRMSSSPTANKKQPNEEQRRTPFRMGKSTMSSSHQRSTATIYPYLPPYSQQL